MKDKSDISIFLDGFVNTSMHSVFSTLENMFNFNVEKKLKDIKQPVLIIGSDKDELFSKNIEKLFAKKLSAKLDMDEGTHSIIIKKPEEISGEIETFIK